MSVVDTEATSVVELDGASIAWRSLGSGAPLLLNRYLGVARAFTTDGGELRRQLTASRVPMLVLCGDNDPSVPPRTGCR